MFKEAYVRDNELIKPDDDFLRRLADSVEQEKKTNVDGSRITWKNVIAIAACFLIVCGLAFASSQMNLSYGQDGMQAGVKAVFQNKNKRQYQQVCKLLQSNSAEIYEMTSWMQDESGMYYLEDNMESQTKIDTNKQEKLICGILDEQYILKDQLGDLENVKYYAARFDDGIVVYFAIEEQQYIYIAEVFGMQLLD